MAEDNVGRAQQDHPRSESELRQWLRNWVSETTDTPEAEIRDDQPLEEFGLSSRDVVILSGELQRITGQSVDATVAYEHNSIGALVDYLGSLGQASVPAAASAKKRAVGGEQAPGERDIAVVGMAGSYPGAPTTGEMWDLLIGYQDGIGEPPEGRWSEWADNPEMVRRMADAQLTGGYLPDLASFDAEFFGLSPLEAANMDPQQRILLKLTWEALEDALIPANTLRGDNVGVFIGTTNNDYANLIIADPKVAHPYALTGNSSSIVANRISYAFDFRGPSVAMDTACSSSLVAIHQAVGSLRDGSSEVAIAGGVNLLANPFAAIAFSETGVLSPTGKIHAFSEDADGIVRSDGAGVIVLKRLSDAVAAGDNILGVIKGSAVNSDGRSNGITAPNPEAQSAVLRAAYEDAGIDPTTVDYVEAHGTGTILGDPIEARALGEVLGTGRDADHPTLLGSAKTNFGHTEAAAGVAGVMKVLMAMREGVLPPSLNYVGPNPHIDFDAQRLEVVEDPREWPEYSGRPVAGVSGFGFGGTNAHVVIAAPTEQELRDAAALNEERAAGNAGAGSVVSGSGAAANADLARPLVDWESCETPAALLPVSGFLPSRRRLAAGDLHDWLAEHESADLLDVAGALAGRNHGRSRGVVRATTTAEAIEGLEHLAEGKKGASVFTADSPAATGPVWVYSGFGSQHRKMGKELAGISSFFAERLAAIDEIVQRESGWSLVEKINDDEQNFDLESAQVAITAVQIALTDLLREFGLRPAAIVGQSLGEIGAAYGSGGLSLEDAMTVACHRSRLMGEGEGQLTGDQAGAMAVIELGPEALEAFRAEHPEFAKVEPAVYAAPGMTTVGGPQAAVAALVEHLDGEDKFARMLDVKGAGHTSMLDPILSELLYEIGGITARPIHTPLYSTVHRGEVYQPGEAVHDAEYFVHCTRHPVWFSDATGQQFKDGYRTFVELSAHPVALMPIMNNAFAHDAGDAKTLYALKRKEPAAETLLNLLAELYAEGADLDFGRLYPRNFALQLPGQHWVEQPHWTDAHPSGPGAQGLPGSRVDLPDGRVAFATQADRIASLEVLAEALADELAPGHAVSAAQSHGVLPAAGEITTIATRTLGGWSLQVFDVAGTGQVLGEAFVSTLGGDAGAGAAAAAPAAAAANANEDAGQNLGAVTQSAHALPEVQEGEARWTPDSGVSVAQRLREIVSESMGYDVEDLPGELPLIDLGLDSLMGMRIKNRVEYEFDLPPLQVQQLRDGSVDTVIAMVEAEIASRASESGAAEQAPEQTDAQPAGDASDAAEGAATDYTVNTGGVAPRDASERLVFATWAKINGKAAAGVTSPLPKISAETAQQVAERLSERSGAEVTAEQVAEATDLAALADTVRASLETAVEGNIRVLRARPAGSEKPSLFLFHPAGGSSVVYQPLTRRLPEDVPVYGVERLEGSLKERAAAYLDEIIALADGRPVVLGGWSFGGALAYEVAFQLAQRAAAGEPSAEVQRIALLDTVQPANPAPDTKEEMHARWDRYAAFVNKTYGFDMEVPHELLDLQGEDVMLAMFQEMLQSPEAASLGLPAGVLEHQRASFVDNRILESLDFHAWAAVDVPVTLFRAERMHDGAIELEPAYRDIAPDGGWGEIVTELDVIQLQGDHLAIVDEPEISKVGRALTEVIQDTPATDEESQDEE
ncbi:polyketide synthase Pks13 [Corynebacterium urealyticum]|uniref:polyketide synthase Pks13 n=1 Tax=Corynebacterium urealyticum TaxID=43771 RepID=UPI0011E713E4|nr:polyketide synthase Pks13 [Corynebacterium urealyticum]TYR15242.1 type I polyketide synthase [Corynebacterium urealyticum]